MSATDGPEARPLVLLAGGGTVGHLAPGFAIREELARLGVAARLVTPGEAKERPWFPPGEPEPLHVAAPRLPRRPTGAATFPFRMGGAVLDAGALLRRERPSAVVALGGWPCAPLALAALAGRVPLFLLATDAVPGAVVRALHGQAARTYVTTEAARDALPRPDRGLHVGRIVRQGVVAGLRSPARFGFDPSDPSDASRRTIFAVGGSLGARGLNDAVARGIASAVAADPTLASRLRVIHSTGPADEAEVRKAYARAGVAAFVSPFIQDVGNALVTADLVVCRGGAGTLAEIEALARPAVVVPYPHHADRQQWKNAAPLAERGAVRVVEEASLDPDAFRREVLDLLFHPVRLAAMSAASGSGGGAPGAATIAEDLVRSIGGAGGRAGAPRADRRRGPSRRSPRPTEVQTCPGR